MTLLKRELVRFGFVGSLGFVVDLTLLVGLVQLAGWHPLVARIVAMAVAVLCTWWLHRHWTFGTGRLHAPLPQAFVYGTVQILGLAVNYSVFSMLVLSGGLWRSHPALAVVVGSLSAMGITYLLAKKVAFARPRDGRANNPWNEPDARY